MLSGHLVCPRRAGRSTSKSKSKKYVGNEKEPAEEEPAEEEPAEEEPAEEESAEEESAEEESAEEEAVEEEVEEEAAEEESEEAKVSSYEEIGEMDDLDYVEEPKANRARTLPKANAERPTRFRRPNSRYSSEVYGDGVDALLLH
eukprot:TRINITY_DN1850_c0_g1_i4.p2 TRINITY_DN1850_c0_g1~~TRINITY_DN1850_c0_g1_i4.p2  ORF type:complete len:145 (-),score=15.78 TRINITY_DN1850_c0_g1_i4:70-504(-)